MTASISIERSPKSDAVDLLENKPFINRHGLAKLLICSYRKIQRMDDSGKLPKPLVIGRARYWRVSEIDAWLNAGAPSQREWEARRRLRKS